MRILDNVAAQLKANPACKVKVSGMVLLPRPHSS